MEQVEYVMGTPLIKDSFNGDRWDYVYNIKRGDQPRKQHRITIFFEYESLKYFTGDFIPSNVSDQADSDAVAPQQES
jgi:outer membrane protein assembly factor BamE